MKTKILYYLTFVYMLTVGLAAFYIFKPPASVDAQCVELTLDATAPYCTGGSQIGSPVQTNINLGAVSTVVCHR